MYVRGIDLEELTLSEECCGFGGTFSIKNADTSIAMLQDKIHHINETGATVCSAADNSCLMHIGGGLSRQEREIRPRSEERRVGREREGGATPYKRRRQGTV